MNWKIAGYVPELNTPQAKEYMIESYRNEERDRERINDAKDIQEEMKKTKGDHDDCRTD
jgi:hypothetical protein